VTQGPDIAPDMLAAERAGYGEAVLTQRLRDALARLNPAFARRGAGGRLPQADAAEGVGVVARNGALHRLLVDGMTVEYRDAAGAIRGGQVRVQRAGRGRRRRVSAGYQRV
jgi:type I restriction enzyme R subunit